MEDTMQEDQLLGAKSDINIPPPIEEEIHTDNVCLEVFIWKFRKKMKQQSFQLTPRFCCANQAGEKTSLKIENSGVSIFHNRFGGIGRFACRFQVVENYAGKLKIVAGRRTMCSGTFHGGRPFKSPSVGTNIKRCLDKK